MSFTSSLQVHVNIENGIVYTQKVQLNHAVPHNFGTHAAPWFLRGAIQSSKYYTPVSYQKRAFQCGSWKIHEVNRDIAVAAVVMRVMFSCSRDSLILSFIRDLKMAGILPIICVKTTSDRDFHVPCRY